MSEIVRSSPSKDSKDDEGSDGDGDDGSTEEELKSLPPTGMNRVGRRRSISMPHGLDLLLQIAEYSWGHTAEKKEDYFDLVAKAGLNRTPAARVRLETFPTSPPTRPLQTFQPIPSETEEEDTDIEMGEESNLQNSINRPRRIGISLESESNPGEDDKELEFDGEYEYKRVPLGQRRKPSIIPLSARSSFKANGINEKRDKSLTVLLRTKINSVSTTIPKVFKPRQGHNYKLQAFVAILFLTIILLVGSIYVMHKEKELQKAYFDRIRFSGKDRRFHLANLKGREVLSGILGMSLTSKDKSWPCLPIHQKKNQSCLEWIDKGRLYFRVSTPRKDYPAAHRMQCYGVLWESLNDNFPLKDCFMIGGSYYRGFHFYGGGETNSNQWPLNRTRVPMSPFITGHKLDPRPGQDFQWGRTLRRFFANSGGASIELAKDIPLHVSINDDDTPGMLCFQSKLDEFIYPVKLTPFPILNYTLCTGEHVGDVSVPLSDRPIWDEFKHSDLLFTQAFSTAPIWKILPETINMGNMSQESLLNHTDRISALLLSEGYILIDESWQKHIGDFEMDSSRFPSMAKTFETAKRRGFKIAVTILPFFSVESLNYHEGLQKMVWVREKYRGKSSGGDSRASIPYVPAMMYYKGVSVVVLDITKESARAWFKDKVGRVVKKYNIDALYVDIGSAHDLPQYYEFEVPLLRPDDYKQIFMKSMKEITFVTTIGVSGAVKLPKLPTFVALSPTESSWEGLQSIIPNILTLGVAGFPFVIPGSIGGDFKTIKDLEPRMRSQGSFDLRKPSRELYIRWLELVHFLPVVQYTYLPSDYNDTLVSKIAGDMNYIRKNKLHRYIEKAIESALTTGLPIIRPLWMIDPNCEHCFMVNDEFSLGSDVIVAPILRENTTSRDIYLPKGRWRDETDGSTTKGEKWLPKYRVKESQIPYFTRIVDVQ